MAQLAWHGVVDIQTYVVRLVEWACLNTNKTTSKPTYPMLEVSFRVVWEKCAAILSAACGQFWGLTGGEGLMDGGAKGKGVNGSTLLLEIPGC